MSTPPLDDVALAAVALIGRCGASQFQIRWSDDQQPVVWLAVAVMPDANFDAAAGTTPRAAIIRLAELLVDGGTCAHCGLLTFFDEHFDQPHDAVPGTCWYVYDPELRTFRRSCE